MATKLTEEEKKARAEARKAAKLAEEAKAKEAVEEPKKNDEIELLKAQVEMYQKQMAEMMETMQKMQQPQVITVSSGNETVRLLWQAEVADDNKVMFGQGGRLGSVTGKVGEFFVPKTEFTSMVDEACRYYMDKRWLIVLDGLTPEEREAYRVNYKNDEYLDREAFRKIVEMGDKILEIFPHLCDGNKMMVAQRYMEAYQNHSPFVKEATVRALNELSKNEEFPKGLFMPIIESMNAEYEVGNR